MITYTGIVRGKFLFDGDTTIEGMIDSLLEQLGDLKAMKEAGIRLSDEVDDDHAFLTTDDPEVAKRFGFTILENTE